MSQTPSTWKKKHQLYLNGCIDVGLSLKFLCFSTQEKCNFYNIFFSSFRSRLGNFSDLSISILVRWLVVSICISYVVDIFNVILSGSYLYVLRYLVIVRWYEDKNSLFFRFIFCKNFRYNEETVFSYQLILMHFVV